MGIVYPVISSYLIEKAGLPPDAGTQLLGADINYHTWLTGYLAYLCEIEAGLSKYPIEYVTKAGARLKRWITK